MPDPKSATTDTIDAAAAQWLARRDRGLTATEQDAYLQWLRSDPRHGGAVARLEQAWGALDALNCWQPGHSVQPNPDLLAVPRRRVARWIPAGLAAAAVLAAGFFLLWPARDPAVPPPTLATVTQSYERRLLPDGSVIELNRGAAVIVDYSAAGRRVELMQGEAHFTVAKNPDRPFVVQAGLVTIRAVGTAFNVRLEPDTVEVLVTEGRVRVDKPVSPTAGPVAELPLLEAGQRAIIATVDAAMQAVVAPVSVEDIATALAWQPKRLEFFETPLDEVLTEFNRHGGPQLVIGDPSLVALRVGGSFRADNAEAFVRLLEGGFGVQAERTAGRIILRRAR
ncbi:MAG TPA: FecR domain-containing protein [Opitutaceae bacterium]|nr:FecR domain-containing protein [Opitutaceae bacterium]